MHTIKKGLLFIMVLAVGAYLFVTGLREFRGSRRLAAEGKSTTAKVVNDRLGYRHRHVDYYLTVEFQTEAHQNIRQEMEVDYDTYSAGRNKNSVTVHYLPGDPDTCQAGDTVETKWTHALMGAFILGCGLLWCIRFKQPVSRAELADVTAEHLSALCSTDQTYRTANVPEFKHLDLVFYDNCQRLAEARGFVFVEDLEEIPAKPIKGIARTFQRILLSQDGTAILFIGHIKPCWMLKVLGARELRLFGIDTKFSNDTFVITDNASALTALDYPPSISMLHLPGVISPEILFEAHLKRVTAHCASHPETVPVAMTGAEDIRSAMKLQQQFKAEFRRENGLSKSELARLAGVSSNPVIDNLHADLERRRERSKDERNVA